MTGSAGATQSTSPPLRPIRFASRLGTVTRNADVPAAIDTDDAARRRLQASVLGNLIDAALITKAPLSSASISPTLSCRPTSTNSFALNWVAQSTPGGGISTSAATRG